MYVGVFLVGSFIIIICRCSCDVGGPVRSFHIEIETYFRTFVDIIEIQINWLGRYFVDTLCSDIFIILEVKGQHQVLNSRPNSNWHLCGTITLLTLPTATLTYYLAVTYSLLHVDNINTKVFLPTIDNIIQYLSLIIMI